ncbi:histidine kinase [Allochromatium humboldtianum]|uniref:Histidine kinase n=1 Tax=Allochromatium humboldtianum TaxID=504901 RepID=A0A850R784_9GAMM|nr:histidine kinase [Allochromatium humboldtianum]NVZ10559.1 histidine kinase [Allochromatium humboldtianum]
MNISALNPTTPEDWFALGSAVFEGRAARLDRYPPLNDMQAQRGWLAGFSASWMEASERHDRDPARYPPTLDLWAHLTLTLTGCPDLLRQLGAYRRGAQSWGDH